MQPAEPALPSLLAVTACRHSLPSPLAVADGCIRFQKLMAAVDCWA
jgi:hypothetical protein